MSSFWQLVRLRLAVSEIVKDPNEDLRPFPLFCMHGPPCPSSVLHRSELAARSRRISNDSAIILVAPRGGVQAFSPACM